MPNDRELPRQPVQSGQRHGPLEPKISDSLDLARSANIVDEPHASVPFDLEKRNKLLDSDRDLPTKLDMTAQVERHETHLVEMEELDKLRDLRAELKSARARREAALLSREQELNDACSAVERAARSLELQRREFDELHRRQVEAIQRRQQQLEERVQSLAAAIQQQEKTVAECEKTLRRGLKEIENARCRFQREQSDREIGWKAEKQQLLQLLEELKRVRPANDNEQRWLECPLADGHVSLNEMEPHRVKSSMPLELPRRSIDATAIDSQEDDQATTSISHRSADASALDNDTRAQADQLPYEICDRLVLRDHSWRTRLRIRVFGVLAVVAGSIFGIYQLWRSWFQS